MNILKIKQFLDKNPCLSSEWKEQLLNVITNSNTPVTPLPNPTLEEYVKYIEQFEGFESRMYKDTRGIPTIGIGTNLYGDNITISLEALGYRYNEVLSGVVRISKEAAIKLAETEIKYILHNISSVCNIQDFDSLPFPMKLILVDMAYNLGLGGLSMFKKMIAAVNERDYRNVIVEMKDSKWYNQVGNRSKHHVEVIERLILSQLPTL